jgi:hypothetical protein
VDVVRAIRFPKDSEHVAIYTPREQRLCLDHIADGERNGIPLETLRREMECVHAVKATFDAELIS